MKIFITILLLPLFVSVQSMAAVCSAKCSIGTSVKNGSHLKAEESEDIPSCHKQAKSEKEDNSSDQGEDCGSKVCELDVFLKSELSPIDFGSIISNDFLFVLTEVELASSGLYPVARVANAPPGIGFFFKSPIYLQKSSYLI